MVGEQAGMVADPAEGLIADWNVRPWVLGALLAVVGLGLHFTMPEMSEPTALHGAAAGFLLFGGFAAAFTLDRGRIAAAALFALLIGLVMGGIAYHVVRLQERAADGPFVFAAGVFFTLLAVPLFQAGFLKTRLATDYRETHFHVWADAISGGGALAFTGLSWLLLALLDALFGLLGIEVIGELMGEGWFAWMWSGAAFGAALGVLRENLKIIGALQNVVMLVFALLAVPLAAALLVFLVLLLASGGAALWEATDAATPILLACAAGSFVLFNAIIRDDDAARSRNRVMLAAGAVLAAVVLPLVVFAAIGMGLRIDQRGLSPERIWALIAIAVAAAYGVAAWVALARGVFRQARDERVTWSEALRRANLNLAVVVCGAAFVLALPFWDFGAVAARNQVARLESGKTALADFDFTALRWDFGDSGRVVLARLAAGEGEAARLAGLAEAQEERPWMGPEVPRQEFAGNLRVQPDDPALRAQVITYLTSNPWLCSEYCVAIALDDASRNDPADGRREVAIVQRYDYVRVLVGERGAERVEVPAPAAQVTQIELKPASRVELREETARFIYVDGQRMGGPVD